MKVGTAAELLGYTSPGEASDWILAATGIPAISPELGTSNPESNGFRIDDVDVVIDVMDQGYPIIEKTIEKLRAKVEFKQASKIDINHHTNQFQFQVEIKNEGMTDMKDFTIISAQASVEATFNEP